MGRCKIILLTVLATVASLIPAQADDTGLILDLGVEQKVSKHFTLGALTELRTRNDFRSIDHFTLGVSGKYKFTKWLKADAGYEVIVTNNREHLTLHDDGSYNNWRPTFYSTRHRFTASVTGDVDLGRFNFSLRERYQYTYRPETTTQRYDFDNDQMESCIVSAKNSHILRSRLKVEYNIPHCKLTPSVGAEIYTARSLEKTKFSLGGTYTLKKHHSLEMGYHYQLVNHTVKHYTPDTHHLVLGYTYKF